MEPLPPSKDSLTTSQRSAVTARGNVLVMAGAGTGKTKTLVERCLHCLEHDFAAARHTHKSLPITQLLVVTFTEAAAAEMRQRLRQRLEEKIAATPHDSFWAEQLAGIDLAHIGTLHGFCLRLIREHFYDEKLQLDPQLAMLDEGEAKQRANETLDEQFQAHYAGADESARAVQDLIQSQGGGRDEKIRALVLRLHHYSQTRPDAAGWLAGQIEKFSVAEPVHWQGWLLDAIADWRDDWLPVLTSLQAQNEKAAELVVVLSRLKKNFTREAAAEILGQILSADDIWPARRKTVLRLPLKDLFDDAAFLAALAPIKNGNDPLAEDWGWVRGHMATLLRLAQEFAQRFAARKLADGVLDFHDLEQFALKLLWDFPGDQPTAAAEAWRQKLRFIFVDEYQDINAAQDKIIAALSRDPGGSPAATKLETGSVTGNRFLVGDVKQSIYRFRLADPKIFRQYARSWNGEDGQVIPLAENFRSRAALLDFTNSIFSQLMREELGGVAYDEAAKLKPGQKLGEVSDGPAHPALNEPRAELLLRLKAGRGEELDSEQEPGADELADLGETEKEARQLALRLKQLRAEAHQIWDDQEKIYRAAEWRDMAVLLRAMSGKSEIYALEFERAGVPLVVARGGFYEGSEISDLLSLLQLLDNPLQDVPVIAVLRSPFVGCSLDELAAIRRTAQAKHFWTALARSRNPATGIPDETRAKIETFLERFARWRKLARQASLSRCLEAVLAETHYDDWLKSRPRGAQRHANVGRFLNLAQKFDQFQRQGLFRFLKFIAAQREAEVEPDVAALPAENSVRLMSIHQSKGLEFPVVAVADLAKNFNTQDLREEIIFDEKLGLCPKVKPPHTGRRYPSLPHWLAQRHQRREQAGEELRLLYVALTRARDTLILTGSLTQKKWESLWAEPGALTPQKILAGKSYADWLGLWFAQQPGGNSERTGKLLNLRWRIADDADLAVVEETESQNPKPEIDPTEFSDETLRRVSKKLTWKYGFSAATQRSAKSSVTALRRQAVDEAVDEAEPVFIFPSATGLRAGELAPSGRNRSLNAAEAGTAHHKFLQHVALAKVGSQAALIAEAIRLEQKKILTAAERAALDMPALAAFWDSDSGRKIQAQTADVKRELAFTAKFSPAEIFELVRTKSAPGLETEFIVVQGVADLVVVLPQEIWLLDFKTDQARPEDLPEKLKTYAPQLRLYARALGKIYARPVTNCWLHFLSAQQTLAL